MRNASVSALMHAARVHVVLGILGRLLVMMAALSAVPALVALSVGGSELALRLGLTLIGLVLVGVPLARLQRMDDIQWNEALAVTGLAFALAAAVMVWPLTCTSMDPLGAWFEAVSGVTTTGLTTLRGADEAAPELLFLRAWMQWYGGLGVAVLTVALIMRHHASARRLLETTGETLTHAGAREHARLVFLVYAALTIIAIAAVWLSGLEPFSAVVHALAAVATGGFAASDANIAPLPTASIAVLSLVCVAAAISLPLYATLVRRGPRKMLAEPEVRALFAAILITAGLLAGLDMATQATIHDWSSDLWPTVGNAFALAVSAQTDTGFSTVDVGALSPSAQVVLMVSMTIGGCTGSTAGGIKLIRLLILIRLIQVALRRTAASERAVIDVRIGGDRLEERMLTGALQLLGLWAIVLLVGWIAFLLYDHPPLASLFEVVSATANAGLSSGLTAPDLESPLKLVLTACMLFGRVEVLAMLVLLYPPTWIGRRRSSP